jgi:hypothetical protein
VPVFDKPGASLQPAGEDAGRKSPTLSCKLPLGDGSSRSGCRHLSLLAENPYRVAFLPIDFDEPIQTDYSAPIDVELTRINVGSLYHLAEDLQLSASELGITLVDGLPDQLAEKINSF